MVKKPRKKAQKAQRNARDIQTPAPTEVSSDSESHQPESSSAQELRQEHSQNKKGKAPERKARFVRSPTLPDDFAPNAGDHESNDETDIELGDASDQDAPIEHKLDPLSHWVKNVIRSETSKESEKMVEDFFTSQTPNYEGCLQFFRRLNQHIRGANEDHDVNDIDTGTIPETGYNALCETWQQAANKAIETSSSDEFWAAYNTTRGLLKTFNKRHYLPKSWNISQEWAEQLIRTPNPSIDEDTDSTSDSGNNQPDQARQLSASEESGTESDIDIDGSQLTGLDALEARTMKQQRQLHSAKVLYWWPKGTGSQIFVRYGSRSTPIYRIRAGSYESYNPSRVERVLTTKTRGTAKVTGTRNGLPEEFWKYQRKDVEDFIGIGWKVEDDDEQGLNPLNLLLPAKGIVYPQTRILVKWKDGLFTLEGRTFIRRITAGSALDGDRVIYQKAEELESTYRRKHGLDDIDEDYDSEVSEPARNTNQRRSKTTNHFVASESDDDGSDASIQSSHNRSRRYRSEPARGPASSTQRRKSTHKMRTDSATEIKELERQIRLLKMRSPMPPQETQESQQRRRRGDRGRTA
ncbi:hypothetical protein N7497_001550 [Penicillium chrysogenum]|jgi:hypothetical protein|uniref:Uncharacterized protein n=1 Tax=Penicillium chrysogenum TaxID=5076 RepID=A0ABQ8W6N1_PENCH|nr:hypothetical protein N7505_010991 [Penicillium chrysogenum]KAJ6168707.1 hypothetical protein N7497_001550 [Penicillium chrysogenum]